MKSNSTPPPPASAFLREFTHTDNESELSSSSHSNKKGAGNGGAAAIVSNLFGGSTASAVSCSDSSSMKHRQESKSYDQRAPKLKYSSVDQEDDNQSTTSNNSKSSIHSNRSSGVSPGPSLIPALISNGSSASPGIPERGWGVSIRQSFSSDASTASAQDPPFQSQETSTTVRSTSIAYSTPSVPRPSRKTFGARLLDFFNPRTTDVQQFMLKLETQFRNLDIKVAQYNLEHELDYTDQNEDPDFPPSSKSSSDKSRNDDPKHPLNNPNLIRDIHYVGRSADDLFATQISNLLITGDNFGSVTELWLNNNMISDEGASAIASFLELPSCALVELWLGKNKIGPVGTALISAALSSNEKTQLKCLGLYSNPMGNAGAGCLAQMLRGNHVLVTVDVHGCLYEEGKHEPVIEMETYGCRVIESDEPMGEEGCVTNQRLLDVIQKFSAFNRINPTREQAIRGLMKAASTKKSSTSSVSPTSKSSSPSDSGNSSQSYQKTSEQSEDQHQQKVSKFLSELCVKPGSEHLTNEEKRSWKDCEWEGFQVEMEKAREFQSVIDDQMAVDDDSSFVEDETSGIVRRGGAGLGEEEEIGHNLDHEVVKTESKSWRDLK
mmetsp:Transcript_19959/g.40891  ORF Transcript_19959/g.40891 Transcript_19959/m.40891 type:complete len:607 (-) Transcript_19959:10-1830(-)